MNKDHHSHKLTLGFLVNPEKLHYQLQWLKSVRFKHCFKFVAEVCFGVGGEQILDTSKKN